MKNNLLILFLIVFSTDFLIAQSGITLQPMPTGYTNQQLGFRNAINIDSNDKIWIGFDRIGLGRFNPIDSSWIMYDSLNSGLPRNSVTAIEFDQSGNKWIGTKDGLAFFDGTNWTVYNTGNSSIIGNYITALAFNGSNLWIGTRSGISVFNGSTWNNYSTSNSGLINDTVTYVAIQNSNLIWIGTTNGLSKFDNAVWTNYTTANSNIRGNSINYLLLNNNNDLWIATTRGLSKFNGNTFNNFFCMPDELDTAYAWSYRSLAKDATGNIFCLRYNKIGKIDLNDKFKLAAAVNNPILFADSYLKFDSNGKLWMAPFIPPGVAFGYFIENQSAGFFNGLRPESEKFIDINQVSALIQSQGDLFWDLQNPQYHVPKCLKKSAIYISALWIGGLDPADNLHMAAMNYRQTGVDYWPGPLDTTNASIDSLTSATYNTIWKIDRFTIEDFKYHFLNGSVGNGTYPVPNEIITWPAHGTGNYSRSLAPFFDFNNDGNYNPYDGDYPLIKGDQQLYWIFNDNYATHQIAEGSSIGLEIHGSAYAFNCDSLTLNDSDGVINYTTFYHYRIINRSDTTYHNMYAGIFSDVNLGYSSDDYGGCDTLLNASFVYNGDNYDDLPDGYGNNPPMLSNMILKGPEPDPNDGVDNDHDGIIDEAGEENLMNHFVSFFGSFFDPTGKPQGALQHYNYMQSIWKDSTHLTYGGSGYNVGSTNYTNFMFPGTPYDTAGWSEQTVGNNPVEERFVTSTGPFTLASGQEKTFDFAYVFTWDSTNVNGLNTSVAKNISGLQKVRQWYDNNSFPSCMNLNVGVNSVQENNFEIYPNPANTFLNIIYPQQTKNAVYEIYDVTGRCIKKSKLISNKIDVKNLLPALYFLKVNDGNKVFSAKFVRSN